MRNPTRTAVSDLPRWASVAALLVAVGAWISFRRTFALWGAESDTADLVMLWEGWRQSGWSFVTSWFFTPDNWLLSLAPFDFALFAALGASPAVVVATGWLIFVACAALATILALQVSGRGAALWIAPLMFLSGPFVLGTTGFLSYPVTHNISVAWGLLAVAAALRWLTRGRFGWLLLAGLALVIDAASDPWAAAAFLLPMLLACAVLLPLQAPPGTRGALATLLGVCLGAGWLAWTRLFGLFGFVARAHVDLADRAGLAANLAMLGRVVPLLFNPVPGLPESSRVAGVVVWLVLVGLVGAAVLAVGRRFRKTTTELRFLLATGAFSCGGVVAAFLIGRLPLGLFVGRFFLNVYVLLPLMLACILSSLPAPRLARWGGAAMAGCMMVAGVATDSRSWRQPLVIQTAGPAGLAAFLERNGLRYGYGPYWGSYSGAVTWLSGGRVRIRAVAFDARTGRISPRRLQTSALWYRPADRPADVQDVFVVVRRDPENCDDLSVCRAGVVAQFGPPSRALVFEDAQILVWPGPIVDRLDGL